MTDQGQQAYFFALRRDASLGAHLPSADILAATVACLDIDAVPRFCFVCFTAEEGKCTHRRVCDFLRPQKTSFESRRRPHLMRKLPEIQILKYCRS